ncbi:hypothetical protein HK104_007765 [Borealophlyctis nickersoniae]|nr:hypothetical protein HK104_007765 [Borealophlyctis nickersoniae]
MPASQKSSLSSASTTSTTEPVQVSVFGIDGKKQTYTIHLDGLCRELMESIHREQQIAVESQHLLYTNKTLEAHRRFSEYGIEENSSIYLVLRLRGGGPRGPRKTTPYTDEADMITLDADPTILRVKMPCGHPISPASLREYAQREVEANKAHIKCPHAGPSGRCAAEWDFRDIRRFSRMNSVHRANLEDGLAKAFLKELGAQKCPKCTTYCKRTTTDVHVQCPHCNHNFCWLCLDQWVNPNSKLDCGNKNCDQKRVEEILKAGNTTELSGASVPRRRLCPKCGTIEEFISGCPNVKCPCGHAYW